MRPGTPLYLIGFMACGKTTLGEALTSRMPGHRFVDLDEAVEAMAHKTIPEIFEHDGEAAFRALESEALRKFSEPGAIIACGGGTPCQGDNMDFMLTTGTVVWLVADDDVTIRRLRLARGQRPLVDKLLDDSDALRQHIAALKAKREPHYSRAHLTFDSNRLEDEEQIADSVEKFMLMVKGWHNADKRKQKDI